MQKLVIVESPAKAHTIKGYLGSGYKVVASKGHVRDLPKSTLGIDVDNNFEAHYINIRGKGELIRELKKEAKAADKIFLATDPDREGEAISWHLATALGVDPTEANRITFNEITKAAVKDAIKRPRRIDMDLVNSQQARRILDRIVGYKLSPFLWKTVRNGLSAGRVQSVATRIIVDRENEIRAFVPKEYWTVDADLITEKGKKLTARFYGKAGDGKKTELTCESEAMEVVNGSKNEQFKVREVKRGKKFKNPSPPFITSTLQQEASRKLNFQSQRTMKVAQELYEGINLGSEFGGVQGLITYMRTDSLRVADEARAAAKEYINERYGDKYYPENPRVYKTKSGAQDAHESIRPSRVSVEPQAIRSKLTPDQYKLYKLIWDRFVSSQMASAELSTVQIDIGCAEYVYRSSGYTVKFPGFMALYEESADVEVEKSPRLPQISEDELLETDKITPEQHFTEPPARYTEATLIKFLEERGIGRPSTYTPIITIITTRGYVKRSGKSLIPTPLGEVITKLMCEQFPDIVNYAFTASMEDNLDRIEDGDSTMSDVLSSFYDGFKRELEAAEASVSKDDIDVPVEETDIVCEKCGAKMIVKDGRYGKFAACPNYPECKNTKPLTKSGKPAPSVVPDADGEVKKCEKCGSDLVIRTGRYGSFYACSKYPECKFTKQIAKPLGVKCPKCGADIVAKYGRNRTQFFSCEKYPECDFSSWDTPTDEKCPKCGKMLLKKKGRDTLVCIDSDCGYKSVDDGRDK